MPTYSSVAAPSLYPVGKFVVLLRSFTETRLESMGFIHEIFISLLFLPSRVIKSVTSFSYKTSPTETIFSDTYIPVENKLLIFLL